MRGAQQDEPCFTEAELKALLPPIPDWMRKGPRPKSRQRELFDEDQTPLPRPAAYAAQLGCRPEQINLLLRTARETLIRTDARLVPPNFVQSPWQRLVIEDFRRFNERIGS